MLFSVLMAHYNNSGFLKESLISVYKQTYKNWEIILVDDGSTDNFENVIAEFETDRRIKIFRNNRNMGCAYTKRKCAELACGEILGFLDPDDTLAPNAIEIMVEAHSHHPSFSIIYSTHYLCDEKLNIRKAAGYQRSLPPDTTYLLLGDGSIHHFATFKKELYARTNGIYPKRKNNKAIDQDLYYLLEEQGETLFIDELLYYYRIHSGGISTLKNKAKASLAHYTLIEEACQRRIKNLKKSNSPDAGYWTRKYVTRYHKIRIIRSIREKKPGPLLTSLAVFPFVGGMGNILYYFKKIPKQGFSLLKKRLLKIKTSVE